MCGIAGIFQFDHPEIDSPVLKNMSAAIATRGPDEEGFHLAAHIGLAHRRLSIIDISSGQQPMHSADGRYTIVYNGEAYNFKEIRAELKKSGVTFRTNSDTETVLELFVHKGPTCARELNGMFAFVIWDKKERKLFAARDRMGKKPFYYTIQNNSFIFASELKAILKHPAVPKCINQKAITHFLTYEYVPAPLAMIEGVHKLPQAHTLEISQNERAPKLTRYWNQSFATKTQDSEAEACQKIRSLLRKALDYRLIADVPVGVFLSGGIDSSAMVALLTEIKPAHEIKTFSINFKEASYDESQYSAQVAKQFGTQHFEETLTANLMVDILPQVVRYLDEPFADGSILPTYLLSRFTRQHVKVAIGGDGGDELFAGYPTFYANRVAELFNKFPSLLKKTAHGLTHLLPTSDKNMSLDFKARQFLSGTNYEGVYRNQVWLAGITPTQMPTVLSDDFKKVQSTIDPFDLIRDEMELLDSNLAGDRLLYFYQKFYMCDDILVKVDRASMAHSLEVRAPFLDPAVVAYANSLPYHYKLRGKVSKYILKEACKDLLPRSITHRSKKGFGIPMAGWLKDELKPMLLETLSSNRIQKDGYFNNDCVQALIKEHLDGTRNNRKQLFSLLMLHFWMDEYLC